MNPKIRALVWEQLRVAGIVSLWCFIVAALLYVVIDLSPYVIAASDYLGVHYLLFASGGVLFLFRQNSSGHLVIGYERRLARLPLQDATLALVPLTVRCACYALYGLGLAVILRLHLGYFQPVCMLLFPVVLYALVQSAVWSGSTLLSVGLASAGVVAWIVFELAVRPIITEEALVNGTLVPEEDAALVLLMAVLLAVAFGLSRLGVRWHRSRSAPGLSVFPGARTTEPRHPEIPRPDFSSPLDARVWFDRHTGMVRLVLVFVGGFVVSAPLALLAYLGPRWPYSIHLSSHLYLSPGIQADTLRWLPFLVVIFGAGVIGLVRDFSRTLWPISLTTFTRTKPLDAASLAWAHLLVMTRMLFATLLVVFILLNVLYALLFPGELQVMAASARVGGLFRPVIFYLEPLFWACVLSWLALTCLRPLIWVALLATTLSTLTSGVLGIDILTKESGIVWFILFHCLFLVLILRSVWLAYRCWRTQILSRQFCIVFLGGHVAITAFIWWPGPLDLDVAAHSLFLTFAFVVLLLSPFVALPYTIARKRVIL